MQGGKKLKERADEELVIQHLINKASLKIQGSLLTSDDDQAFRVTLFDCSIKQMTQKPENSRRQVRYSHVSPLTDSRAHSALPSSPVFSRQSSALSRLLPRQHNDSRVPWAVEVIPGFRLRATPKS